MTAAMPRPLMATYPVPVAGTTWLALALAPTGYPSPVVPCVPWAGGLSMAPAPSALPPTTGPMAPPMAVPAPPPALAPSATTATGLASLVFSAHHHARGARYWAHRNLVAEPSGSSWLALVLCVLTLPLTACWGGGFEVRARF
jgi:hypothetical protein